ncbi:MULTISPECIES: DUF6893 family small protein [Rhodococcus]|uniref:Secreted protein n=1 Tax=Rhodococcus aetherivorans TaxID=191292 RepID=A0ABQ0YHM6_9NOCA|nr:membrane protein [Rhodococcus aetherivorans]ETT25002.1 hypothetical protein RR21198_4158 [Rhodococcus rhodochrous ATCC 21198]NCL73573.1 hypothetical protein [Rhodococcus sp. YH1]KDE10286.1 membrane protein [Rhodococcus aetherivorans]CCW13575.1 hypothetical protein EBESD8_41370 [Rhodococcus aetherivorans]
MRFIGMLATAALAAAVIGGVVVTVQSLPDIQRYLRMRRM